MVKKIHINENLEDFSTYKELAYAMKNIVKSNGFDIVESMTDFLETAREIFKTDTYVSVFNIIGKTQIEYLVGYNRAGNEFYIMVEKGLNRTCLKSSELEKLRQDIHPLSTMIDRLNDLIK